MNPHDPDTGFGQEDGQPLSVLREHERDTRVDFLARVRNRIYRRSATAQIVSYSWHAPRMVLVEMASLLNHIFSTLGGNRRS